MSKQQKQLIVMIALFVVAGAVAWWRLQSTSAEVKPAVYKDNYTQAQAAAQTQQTQAQQTNAAATQPSAGQAPAPAGALPPGAQGASNAVDLDALIASVEDLGFDYDVEQMPRNPMRPLVGKSVPAEVNSEGGETAQGMDYLAMTVAQNLTVTGIVWDDNNPMAIVNDATGENQVVYRGFTFPSGVIVEDIEASRILVRVNEAIIPLELEER